MPSFIIVTTAINSQKKAQEIAEILVSRRLASCAHVEGPFTSTYWWKGNMEIAAVEWECAAKTREELYDEVEQTIRANHPYEEPEIIVTPIVAGSRSYLHWIETETRK